MHVKNSRTAAAFSDTSPSAMATTASLSETLSTFAAATDSAIAGLPESSSLLPPENGITLLDTKNDIFLSYLQALALRNLHVIRSIKDGSDVESAQSLSEKLTEKLVEQRVYLERGVRPLEQKIKYQVEKVVKAADDAERSAAQKAKGDGAKTNSSKAADEDDGSGTSDSESDDEVEEEDALAYRPTRSAFAKGSATSSADMRRAASKSDGIYRPPRISATAMPTTGSKEQNERRQPRSRTLDEYVSTELSAAPVAEPSIGSTISAGGRRSKDARQLAKEKERREYEETNLVRLPKESKADKAKRGGGREQRGGGFGGEEWRGLGDAVDRIGSLTKRKGGRESALDRSRKRRATEDGPRGSGSGIGDAFDVKRRRMEKKMRR